VNTTGSESKSESVGHCFLFQSFQMQDQDPHIPTAPCCMQCRIGRFPAQARNFSLLSHWATPNQATTILAVRMRWHEAANSQVLHRDFRGYGRGEGGGVVKMLTKKMIFHLPSPAPWAVSGSSATGGQTLNFIWRAQQHLCHQPLSHLTAT
jgi:hypothetical protein